VTQTIVTALAVAALLGTTAFANAAEHREMRGGGFGDNAFRSESFHAPAPAFQPAFHGDQNSWRRGGWRHDWHDGRLGWWWVVDDGWFFYDAPIYPYPDYIDEPPPPVAAATWYYCAHPQGYYPYVQRCDAPWQPVPAQPQP
jgi:hypothetical protein